MNNAIYKKSFDLFLKNTDEKSVIKKFIKENIPLNKKSNFLDIGGGTGVFTRHFARKVKKTIYIEPNQLFCQDMLRVKDVQVINKKWEDVKIKGKFDFILAAYVVTHFPREKLTILIDKMYNLLSPNGRVLILSIDHKRGSWRNIHTFFYKLIKHKHKSSDYSLKQALNKYNHSSQSFITKVTAKDVNEMINILAFDFHRYNEDFNQHNDKLVAYLQHHIDKDGKKVILEMVHNAYIINKK